MSEVGTTTADEVLDRAFAWTLDRIATTSVAPHYVELAAELGMAPDDARRVYPDLMAAGVPGWLHPDTDYLASFPPFNVQPTQYRVSIDGQPGWYAQCGFEAMAIRWCVPGKTVRVTAPCLDCGDEMVVEMRDEEIIAVEPDTIVGYTRSPVGGDAANRPFR